MSGDETKHEQKSGEAGVLPPFGLASDVLGESAPEKPAPKKAPSGGNGGSAEGDVLKFVTFTLEREEYGLPIEQVREINRVVDITKVPNSPPHVLGVINLRGKILPVIELKQRLNLGRSEIGRESRIVVVENGRKSLGLLVDSVAQVLNISAEQIEEPPREIVSIDENYIQAVGKIDDRMIILLELDRVVGSNGYMV